MPNPPLRVDQTKPVGPFCSLSTYIYQGNWDSKIKIHTDSQDLIWLSMYHFNVVNYRSDLNGNVMVNQVMR